MPARFPLPDDALRVPSEPEGNIFLESLELDDGSEVYLVLFDYEWDDTNCEFAPLACQCRLVPNGPIHDYNMDHGTDTIITRLKRAFAASDMQDHIGRFHDWVRG